jgi:hypothetical protein
MDYGGMDDCNGYVSSERLACLGVAMRNSFTLFRVSLSLVASCAAMQDL